MKRFSVSGKPYSCIALLGAAIFAILFSLPAVRAHAEETKVTSRGGNLGNIADLKREYASAGADSRAGEADQNPPAGQKIVTVTFDKPKDNLPFKQFSKRKAADGQTTAQPTYVDVPADGHGVITDRIKDDSPAQIKVKFVFDLSKDDAAFFAPWAEGNLAPPGGGTGTGQGESPHWAAIYDNGKVSFSPDPIVTGYIKRADGTPDIHSLKVTVTATVFPASKVDQIKNTIAIDTTTVGKDEAKIENIQVADATAGTITFDVYGQVATPVGSPDGDTQIIAKDSDGTILGKAKVVVVIPAAIGTPHMAANPTTFPVTPKNICGDISSKPPILHYPKGTFIAITLYVTQMDMKVFDQFGHLLDGVYDGQDVTENHDKINQVVKNGHYNDPIGKFLELATPQPDTLANRAGWESYKILDIPMGDQPESDLSTAIEVAGHSLDPAAVNRKYTLTKAATGYSIKVTWPDN